MNIGLNDESKLIIIPVTLANHFSLLLIDKEKIYLIDYELYHCMNVRMINNAENMNIKLKEINSLLKQKYNIEEEFFFTLFENELSEEREKEFKDLLKGRYGYDEEILNLIEECLSLKKQIMSSNISYIPKNEAIGNISFFYNQNLCKQMIILNIFSIQGTQTCSYFVLATLKYIMENNLNIQKIAKLYDNGIAQIKIIKIIIEDFFRKKQNIFIINEDIDDKRNNIYYNEENKTTIGIKKNITKIQIECRKNMKELENEEIIKIKEIKNMLSICNYNLKNNNK